MICSLYARHIKFKQIDMQEYLKSVDYLLEYNQITNVQWYNYENASDFNIWNEFAKGCLNNLAVNTNGTGDGKGKFVFIEDLRYKAFASLKDKHFFIGISKGLVFQIIKSILYNFCYLRL